VWRLEGRQLYQPFSRDVMRARQPAPIVTTREYGAIALPSRLNTRRTRERLEIAGRRTGLRTFEARGSCLYALGIVGVIDIGNLIVEILPKSSEVDSAADGAAFLGELLRFVANSKPPTITQAAISTQGGGLFELILSWAVDQASSHLTGGLPRRYVPTEDLSSAIRGRIDIRHLALQRPGRAFELRVRHAPLSENNLIAQAVRWLLGEIARRTQSHRTRNRALSLFNAMTLIDASPPTSQALAALNLSALEAHWRPLILLARTLLDQATPDPARAGELSSVAVLYSLHRLFEDAIRRVLAQGLVPLGFKQAWVDQLLLHSAEQSLIRLKPDFRFTGPNASAGIVGDAKWKRIFRRDRVLVSEDDAYQIATYLTATKTNRAFLISPIDTQTPPLRHRRFTVAGLDKSLTVIGVHLPTLVANNALGEDMRSAMCLLVAAPD
jgi:5-methylcytosine-specific restriction enzyme subunit McrC